MQRKIIVFFLGWLMLAALPAWSAERGALFKVSGSGHTMYLFGTMHVGLPEFYPLEPRIAAAVAGASTLALEIDPLADPAAMAAAMHAHATLAPGSRGYQDLAPEMRSRLSRALREASIPEASIASFKPWLTATILALHDYAALGYRADLSVDLRLAQIARASKVPVIELESMNEQLAMFNRLSVEQQWAFLEESLVLMESGKQGGEVRQIVEAWSSADRAALDAIAARAAADTTVSGRFVQKVMLEERNGPLADKLAQLLSREDNTVAAIGVLHLVGQNSVPAQLSARGIKVERVY